MLYTPPVAYIQDFILQELECVAIVYLWPGFPNNRSKHVANLLLLQQYTRQKRGYIKTKIGHNIYHHRLLARSLLCMVWLSLTDSH